MPSRESLSLRAAAVNVLPATYPNDSKLEQVVLAAEKAVIASTTATQLLPAAKVVAQTTN